MKSNILTDQCVQDASHFKWGLGMRSESSGSNFGWSSIIDGCLLLTVNIYFEDVSILFLVIPNNFSCLNLKRPPSRISSLVTCGASEPAEKWHLTLWSRYGQTVAYYSSCAFVNLYINCPFTVLIVFIKAICEHRQQILVGSHFTNDEYVWNTWALQGSHELMHGCMAFDWTVK